MANLFRRSILVVALAAAAALSADRAQADPMLLINPGLQGNTAYSAWNAFNPGQYPGTGGFPGNAMWSPLAAQEGTAGAVLTKTANGTGGGPYVAGSSIYFGGFSAAVNNNGGSLAVVDSAALAGLKHLTLQIQIGEAWTYDFWNDALPTLSFNGGTQAIAATTSVYLERFFNGTVTMPTGEEDVYINTYRIDWDLSAIATPITSFSLGFAGVQHAQLYKVRVDQSDVAFASVPEPASVALMACGVLPLAALAIRRRRAARA